MGTNCAFLIADLFLYCYESQFMAKLLKDPSRTDLIDKLTIGNEKSSLLSKILVEILPWEIDTSKSRNGILGYCYWLYSKLIPLMPLTRTDSGLIILD